MNHLGTVDIETPRLMLRQFIRQDASAVFRNWASDERVVEFLRWPAHRSIAVTERVLEDWVMEYSRKDYYQWAIVLKENGSEPIGTISVVAQDEQLKMVHIGYCIGARWWGQGITAEAFSAIIPFFFEEVGVKRIESQHDPRNMNSGKVMVKCGLKLEGVLRQADVNNKGIVDAAIYSLLAEEYNATNIQVG